MDSQRAGANLATSGAILGLLAFTIGRLEPQTTPALLAAMICLVAGVIVVVKDAIPAVRQSRIVVRQLLTNHTETGSFRG